VFEQLTIAAIAAGATVDMLTGATTGVSRQRRPTRPTRYTFAIVHESAAGDLTYEVSTNQRMLVPTSVMECGGTAGVFPNLNEKAYSFDVAAFEDIQFRVFDASGAGGAIAMLSIASQPLA
jgi:hypothetical protein